MDQPLSFTAWAALGAVSLASVGALFGAVAGAVARAGGQAPGGALGRHVAEAVARALRRPLAPTSAGAVAGAVDGALFLGVVGLLVGLAAGYAGAAPDHRILLVTVAVTGALALLALGFGVLAYSLQRGGGAGLILFSAVGVGGLLGLALAGPAGAGWGLMGGAVVGSVGAFIHGRETRRPSEESDES